MYTGSTQTAETDSLGRLLAEGIIVCPNCRGVLEQASPGALGCRECHRSYAVADGIPILLHDDSAFSPEQLMTSGATYFSRKVKENRLKQRIRRSIPSLANEYSRLKVDELIRSKLPAGQRPIRGLVCGAGEDPRQIQNRFPTVAWLTSDIDLSYHPHLIADTLALPIADCSQDLVVAEMVLEHVMDITQASPRVTEGVSSRRIDTGKSTLLFSVARSSVRFFPLYSVWDEGLVSVDGNRLSR